MGNLYETIKEEEIMYKDILLPERFPALYIDKYDEVYCYYGIIDNNRFVLRSYPYYLKEAKPSEAKKYLRGYFRIKNGIILNDKKFINEENSFYEKEKYKKIPSYMQLPSTNNNPYGIYCSKYENIEKELSRKVFGLSYNELSELIYHYNEIFQIVPKTYHNKYPSITRSVNNDNYCDITQMWIPANFPYIAFAESGYYYSHISLYGFYEHVKFITQNYIDSTISKKLINSGLNPEVLESLFEIELDTLEGTPIDYYRYQELSDFDNN